jgi:superfamily I DNA/RNA helicase/RecB family exonuclease
VNTPTLVRRRAQSVAEPHWEPAAHRVLSGERGMLRVIGGPGSGKTTLLAGAAADRVHADAESAEHVLVLTGSRRAANAMRSRITALLAAKQHTDGPRTVREPLVRTVHSYAFAVLRRQAAMHELPPPRLLSGPEQDAMVRELLAGDIESGARYWPPRLRAALAVPGYAGELRDLMLRAAERGLGPEHLIEFGKRHGREEWVAAGKFARQYEQVTLLQGAVGAESPQATAPALDAAELVASALLALDTDAVLLREERKRVRHLLVDDVQNFDPLQFRLAGVLGASAEQYVLAGDPDQAIFGFRGADPDLLANADPDGERTVTLTGDHRMSTEVRDAVHRLATRLPGARPRPPERPPERQEQEPERAQGRTQVHLFASSAVEATWVADELRRAHLHDGVLWSEMAVVVRSTTTALPVLRRALQSAGVPLEVPADELPLARQNAVRPFLALLRCAVPPSDGRADPLDPETAEMLLASPLGGADALAMRRLRRGLRRLELAGGGARSSGELLVEVLRSNDVLAGLSDTEAAPVRRISALLATAQAGIASGASVEEVLWRLWQASGLERRWSSASAGGGFTGRAADRDLDAIVALFAAAGRYVDRLPGASVSGFADYLAAQQIVGDTLAPAAPSGEAVTLLTAHAAAGREWTVVAIPGVAEGVWPDLRLRGSLLGVERLVDALSGVDSGGDSPVSATAPLLAEERRLLLVAASRAKHTLLLSAVRGEDEQPSRFLEELIDPDGLAAAGDVDLAPVYTPGRGLVLSELVGELRKVVCDENAAAERRQRAGTQLARLAEAGVNGAHPDEWFGLPEPSTQAPLWPEEEPVTVTPSTLELLMRCPLRWLIERHGGAEVAETPAVTGQLVHALAQAAAAGADGEELNTALEEAWRTVDAGAPWFSRLEARRLAEMLQRFQDWLRSSREVLTEAGVERGLSVQVPRADIGPALRVRGRVDRLELDPEGKPVVVDIKTGKTPVSKDDAAVHPQLALYQLAVALGAFDEHSAIPGGARLLYLAKADRGGGATERVQPPMDAETVTKWRGAVATAAAEATGPEYTATEGPDCPRCPVRIACPLHDAGRQVGQ